ncbi:MAG TPA: cation-transporting P-type ATPase [Candidatus Lokiarchaeia archaeon]|nr:cation-transporting P-type ATPase [Candidatus Lokiarchaeia archaeon]
MVTRLNATKETTDKMLGDLQALPLEEVYALLAGMPAGLTEEDAAKRLETYGYNSIPEGKLISTTKRFFQTLTDIFSLLLFFAALLAFLGQSPQLGIAILIIVFVNAIFTLVQEWQAAQEMRALKTWIPDQAKVMRDGTLKKIEVKNIVPGDIIGLEEGDRVPADARLIEAFNLFAIEIPLTGEFEPQLKIVNGTPKPGVDDALDVVVEEEAQVKDTQALTAQNIVFMSTSIVKGQAKAIVIATGLNTRFGQIAHLTRDIKPPDSPLQKEVSYVARYSFELAFIIGAVFFVIGYFFLVLSIINAMNFIIGVMIACVPEGLQATISSALAINVMKMARKNVLVKRLSAVQALGSITLICTDKTGTLTRGEMTVRTIWASHKSIDISGIGYSPKGVFSEAGEKIRHREHKEMGRLLEIAALCNNARLQAPDEKNNAWNIVGDPTDGAMLVAAMKYGINVTQLAQKLPIIHVFPFDSERKMMTTLHIEENIIKVFTKGAPAKVAALCTNILVNGKVLPLTDGYRKDIRQLIDLYASTGLRVIAVAFKEVLKSSVDGIQGYVRESLESGMTLVGIAAIQDPPRVEVIDAVKEARQAGIKIAMITGDNPTTAKSIAWEVGIVDIDQWDEIVPITGEKLKKMEDVQIAEAFQHSGAIFARITPDEKLRLVNIARQAGEIVAVTGDGANDAPALRQADIGVAMGITGTDIAKESADIILTDDSFTSIVTGIESGRATWVNLRNFIYYAYSHNWAELIPYVLFIIFRTPLPLLPIHVLMIDLCIDIVPSLALSRNPPDDSTMHRPPRSIREHLFKPIVFLRSLVIGLTIGTIGFWLCINTWMAGGWHFGDTLDTTKSLYLKGVTMTFVAIVTGQFANFLTCSTTKTAFYRRQKVRNPWMFYGVVWQFAIIAILVYVPFLQPIFGTAALMPLDWLWLLMISGIIFIIQEIWRVTIVRKET